MSSLGGGTLSNPVDQTWQALREAVLAHPRISGARFDHATRRADLMTEKSVVPSRRRLSAFVVVDTLGTRVVISGAGKRGLSHQIATELLAEVSHRVGGPASAPEDVSLSALSSGTFSDEVWERPVTAHRGSGVARVPHRSHTADATGTPAAALARRDTPAARRAPARAWSRSSAAPPPLAAQPSGARPQLTTRSRSSPTGTDWR